ncbi:MAG TPA: acylneuraminate cytidylyltransferase family protein [Kofleriaceae bacterium]
MSVHPILAVIPARGGSKGLPGKNVRPLAGLPLIAHSLRLAAMCPEIARTIVSTDDDAIAEVVRAHGGDVPFMRPAELAQDDTPMTPVLTHALREIERAEGRTYGSLLLLDPTSPGRLPEDVTRAVALLDGDASAEGVIACSRPTFNPFWVGVVERDGYLAPAFAGAEYARRQDVPTFLRINGALYLWRRDFIDRGASWRDVPHLALEIPEARAFSIDDLYEFQVAEQLIAAGLVELPWLARKTA